MELNSIIFPAPNSDRIKDLSKYEDELIYIPKMVGDEVGYIPCMLHECRKSANSNKYLLYFHGNAEDIFNSNYTVDLTRTVLPYNTLSIEYPGYSIYNAEKNSSTIEEDSLIVYDYLVEKVGIKENDIVVCGRSIGSGPSIYLCSKRRPGGLVLISPFTSIQEVVKSIVGFMKFLIQDRFVNINIIDQVKCPTLFIHGQKDDVVPFKHSIELSNKCNCPHELILPEEMDHNEIHLYEDFLEPLTTFLQRHDLVTVNKEERIHFTKELFEIPKSLKEGKVNEKNKDVVTSIIRKFLNI
jgi:fermentation-respiration switch protein FrsA (DUF1100 family)